MADSQRTSKTYAVYVIECPAHDGGLATLGAKVYIGQTCKSLIKRLRIHRFPGCTHVYHWIAAREREGYAIVMRALADNLTKDEATRLERAYIAQYRTLYTVMNLTEGGEGRYRSFPTPETRAKMSASALARIRQPHSPETRAKFIGMNRGPKTAEHRAKISAALMGRPGRPHTPEQRAKLRAAHVGRKASPETRAKLRASHLGIRPSLESLAKRSATMKNTLRLKRERQGTEL